MEEKKRERLEAAGWTIGSARDFLGLSEEEAAFVETKAGLSRSRRASVESIYSPPRDKPGFFAADAIDPSVAWAPSG